MQELARIRSIVGALSLSMLSGAAAGQVCTPSRIFDGWRPDVVGLFQEGDPLRYHRAFEDFDGDGITDFVGMSRRTVDGDVVLGVEVVLGVGGGVYAAPFWVQIGEDASALRAEFLDLNTDGRLDVAHFDSITDELHVSIQQGDGSFNPLAPVAIVNVLALELVYGDLDADGDPDLVLVDRDGSAVSLYTNNGSGEFVSSGLYGVGDMARDAAIGDFDGDGINDVVVATREFGNPGSISVLKGLGAGVFSPAEHTPVSEIVDVGPVTLIDWDQDGAMDVFIGEQGYSDEFLVVLGDGSGGFEGTVSVPQAFEVGRRVFFEDLDQDGDRELIYKHDRDILAVQMNEGAGVFGDPVVYRVPTGAALFGDSDGDGTSDLCMVQGEFDGSGQKLTFFTGDGLGGFGIEPVDISLSENEPVGIEIWDIDGDGDQDIVSIDDGNDQVVIRTNDGSGNMIEAGRISIPAFAESMTSGDVNGDGLEDIVILYEVRVNVLLANGSGGFLPPINTGWGGSVSGPDASGQVQLGDVDGDGLTDCVFVDTLRDDVILLHGNGMGNFWPPRNSYALSFSRQLADFALVDLDMDGDLDLAISETSSQRLNFFLNDGGADFTDHSILDIGGSSVDIKFVDLDGDGDRDVVATNDGSDSVVTRFNQGNMSFSALTRYDAGDAPYRLVVGDLDGDSDPDMVVINGGYSQNPLVYFNNGSGVYSSAYQYEELDRLAKRIAIGDLTGDGLPDLAVQGAANDVAYDYVLINGCGALVDCDADLDGNGQLDFFDLTALLSGSVDYDGNTVFDFFDLSAFLTDFGAGCP